VIPAAALTAAPAADPIFAAIERHKVAKIPWDAAIDVRADFLETATPRTDEQWERLGELDDAVDEAWGPCEQAGLDLINAPPTTLAGIVAAIQYIRTHGTYMPHDVEFEYAEGYPGGSRETMGWIAAFMGTIADTTAALEKTVQS
jgi:hypothetical protein